LLVMIAPGAGALGLIWVIASYSIYSATRNAMTDRSLLCSTHCGERDGSAGHRYR